MNNAQKVCPEQPCLLGVFGLAGIYSNVLLKRFRYAVFEDTVTRGNI